MEASASFEITPQTKDSAGPSLSLDKDTLTVAESSQSSHDELQITESHFVTSASDQMAAAADDSLDSSSDIIVLVPLLRGSINEILPLQPDGHEIGPSNWVIENDTSSISDLSEIEDKEFLKLQTEYESFVVPGVTNSKPRQTTSKKKAYRRIQPKQKSAPRQDNCKSKSKSKNLEANRKLVILRSNGTLFRDLLTQLAQQTQNPLQNTKRKRVIGLEDESQNQSKASKRQKQRPRKDTVTGLLTPISEAARSSQISQISLAHIDPEILKLSRQLTARLPVSEKLEPSGPPLVWADSRQALCETVPYFKKPQGGCHQNSGHVYSFLYDGVGHCREYMDSDIIIARAGGSMEWDDTGQGQMVQRKDQLITESQVQAVKNDIMLQNPLVVISGDRNQCALIKMPHKYCVMGWYKPIDVWEEKTEGNYGRIWVTVKYRFERLNENENIWHTPKKDALPRLGEVDKEKLCLNEQPCSNCGKTFPQIYLLGWMCLNSACTYFWKLDNEDAPYGVLDYNPAFMQQRTPWKNEEEPYSVIPRLPSTSTERFVGDHLTYINTRGVCCPDCGRCNPRYLFKGWICDNPDCSWQLQPKHEPVMLPQLHSPWDSVGNGPSLARNLHNKELVEVSEPLYHPSGYKVIRYTFTGIEGSFIHAIANNRTNEERDGPNTMLKVLQAEDIGLQRRRFKSDRSPGAKAAEKKKPEVKPLQEGETDTSILPEELNGDDTFAETLPADGDFMTAFSMNYGMPYKFVANGASRSFEDAPNPVRFTRSKLNWAARTFLQKDEAVSFNEQLIFAYMEGQKIEYHDDGEDGLGPCIATLSLGSKAKMFMRMKQKHFAGCSKSGVLTPDRPVPGGIAYEGRLRAWEQLQEIKTTDQSLYLKRLKEIPKELGLLEKRYKKGANLIDINLSHGDIVLMDGYEIQKYLEHKVVPEGYLRFALTCRTVLECHLKPEERPAYEVKEDDYGYDGSELLVNPLN